MGFSLIKGSYKKLMIVMMLLSISTLAQADTVYLNFGPYYYYNQKAYGYNGVNQDKYYSDLCNSNIAQKAPAGYRLISRNTARVITYYTKKTYGYTTWETWYITKNCSAAYSNTEWSCEWYGQLYPVGATVQAFASDYGGNGTCNQTETRTCLSGGKWSGSYRYNSCYDYGGGY